MRFLILLFVLFFFSLSAHAVVYDDAGIAAAQAKGAQICEGKHAQFPSIYTGASDFRDVTPDNRGTGGIGNIEVFCQHGGGYEYAGAFGYAGTCSSRNAGSTASLIYYEWPSCNGGCSVTASGFTKHEAVFTPATGSPYTYSYYLGAIQYSGSICQLPATGDPTPQPDPVPPGEDGCKTVGNLTQCMKPDGRMCATASNGSQFCWTPTTPPSTPIVSPDGSITVNGTNTPSQPAEGATSQGTIVNTTTNQTNVTNTSVTVTGASSGTGVNTCPSGMTGTFPNCTGTSGEQGSSSVSGGLTCDAPPACQGDAVGCANVLQSWIARCGKPAGTDEALEGINGDNATEAAALASAEAYNATKTGNGPDQLDKNITGVIEEVISNAGSIWSPACPADLNPSAGGSTFRISPSTVCNFFADWSFFIIGLANFAAIRIMLRE